MTPEEEHQEIKDLFGEEVFDILQKPLSDYEPADTIQEPQKDEPAQPAPSRDGDTEGDNGDTSQDAVDQHGDAAKQGQPEKKRRLTLNQMTPESKQKEIERRAQAKRDNSNLWHAKWVSKGVPKKQEDPGAPHVPEAEVAGPAGPAAPENPGDVNDMELTVDNVLANEGLRSDMRKVRAMYMTQWVADAEKKTPGSDQKVLQNEASKSWLESELRAQILAASKGQQYW